MNVLKASEGVKAQGFQKNTLVAILKDTREKK